jgi:hypothetical protein
MAVAPVGQLLRAGVPSQKVPFFGRTGIKTSKRWPGKSWMAAIQPNWRRSQRAVNSAVFALS